ncbi:unnamed protein product [Periconia digitata]|uniref:Nucleoside phosphorylase domain-containing protein n=1 Tax=Periconia digitata TaxID=1303443 RepID=A0A9W4TZ20_9PLEO|nr:unnamed protein product [Periconia digitata]
MAPTRLDINQYTIAWVCALPIELSAARMMLEGDEHDTPTLAADENVYSFGTIGGHNIVIACLPDKDTGTVSMASLVAHLMRTFTKIRCGVLVGIGGGVPRIDRTALRIHVDGPDIRLGDVVIGQPDRTNRHGGVVQYGFGKDHSDGFQITGHLNEVPKKLQAAISKFRSNIEDLKRSDFHEHIKKVVNPSFERPKDATDILEVVKCQKHLYSSEDPACRDCKVFEIIEREERADLAQQSALHYGTIASGTYVVRNGRERDRLSETFGGVACIEMEAAGLMNQFPCLVIRGISDYADHHKNDVWQRYAALAAAACTKEFLHVLSPATVDMTPTAAVYAGYVVYQSNSVRVGPRRPRHTEYIDRSEITDDIRREFDLVEPASNPVPLRYLLYGLAGRGKSQICIDYYIRYHTEYQHSIWIDASTKEKLRECFVQAGEQAQPRQAKKMTPEDVVNWLSNTSKDPWLLIFDDVQAGEDYKLENYMPANGNGRILVTSKKGSIGDYHCQRKLTPMSEVDALKLLTNIVKDKVLLHDDPEEVKAARKILQKADYSPLAISLTANTVTATQTKLSKYLEIWDDQLDANKENDSNDRNLYTAIQASYNQFRRDTGQRTEQADQLLRFFAILDTALLSEETFYRTWNALVAARGTIPSIVLEKLVPWIFITKSAEKSMAYFTQSMRETFSLLESFSFVERVSDANEEHRRYHMHGSIRAWLNSFYMTKENRFYEGTLDVVASTLATSIGERPPRSYRKLVIPYIQGLFGAFDDFHRKHALRKLLKIQPFDSRARFEAAFRFSDTYSVCGYFSATLSIREEMYNQLMSDQIKVDVADKPILSLVTSLLAESHADLGNEEKSLELRKQALEQQKQMGSGPENRIKVIAIMSDLAHSYSRSGRIQDVREAYSLREQVHKELGSLVESSNGKNPPHQEFLMAKSALATSLHQLKRYAEAIPLLIDSISGLTQMLETSDPCDLAENLPHKILIARAELAKVYSETGRLRDALDEREHILLVRKQHNNDFSPLPSSPLQRVSSPSTNTTSNNPSNSNFAKPLLDHDTLVAMEDLAESHSTFNAITTALALRKQVLQGFQDLGALVSTEHPGTNHARYNLARSYYEVAQAAFSKVSFINDDRDSNSVAAAASAKENVTRAVNIHRYVLKKAHPREMEQGDSSDILSFKDAFVRSLCLQAKIQVASSHGRRQLDKQNWSRCSAEGTKSYKLAIQCREEIASAIRRSKRWDDAERALRSLSATNELAMCHWEFGEYEEAKTINQNVVKQQMELNPRHENYVHFLRDGGMIYHKLKSLDKAVALLEEAYGLAVDVLGGCDLTTLDILDQLARTTRKWRLTLSEKWFFKLWEGQRKVWGEESETTRNTRRRLDTVVAERFVAERAVALARR